MKFRSGPQSLSLHIALRVLAGLALVCILAACGNKGPLQEPKPKAPTETPAS